MDEKALLARIEALEKEVKRQAFAADAVEVQNLMSRYIFYLENGWIGEVWDDLFSHKDPDRSTLSASGIPWPAAWT